MINSRGKWWLAAVVLCCLAPATFAHDRCDRNDWDWNWDKDKHCAKTSSVPEGGSTAIYLLGAGLTCFGAMFLRSKLAKPTKS
jgi:hypothetical protein